jgi:hypothetical protein
MSRCSGRSGRSGRSVKCIPPAERCPTDRGTRRRARPWSSSSSAAVWPTGRALLAGWPISLDIRCKRVARGVPIDTGTLTVLDDNTCSVTAGSGGFFAVSHACDWQLRCSPMRGRPRSAGLRRQDLASDTAVDARCVGARARIASARPPPRSGSGSSTSGDAVEASRSGRPGGCSGSSRCSSRARTTTRSRTCWRSEADTAGFAPEPTVRAVCDAADSGCGSRGRITMFPSMQGSLIATMFLGSVESYLALWSIFPRSCHSRSVSRGVRRETTPFDWS